MNSRLLNKIGFYVLVALIIIWVIGPIFIMLVMSFQPESEILTRPPILIPKNPILFNYYFIFNTEEAMKARLKETGTFFLPAIAKEMTISIRNSCITSLFVLVMNMILAPMATYTFVRLKFKGSWPLFLFTVTSRLLPAIAVILPFYLIIKSLGLLDTIWALVMIYTAYTLPITIWILYGYFQGIPPDMEEAALIDGYSRLEVFFKFVFPIIKPAVMAIGIYSFMLAYVEFFYAFIITTTAASHTLPVIIASLGANPVSPKGILMAAGVVGMLPPIVVIVTLRRFLIRGLTRIT